MRLWEKYKGSAGFRCEAHIRETRHVVRSKVCSLRSGALGFTLIELLAVMAVIGILMGTSFVAIQRAIERAKVTRARSEVQSLQQAWLAYWNTYQEFPSSVGEMDADAVRILGGDNPLEIAFMEFDARHRSEGFLDPWGDDYYRVELDVEDVDTDGWTYTTRFYLGNGARGSY